MRKFTPLSPLLWQSKRFLSLPNDACRYFYMFLATGRHQTTAGLFRLPDAYAAHDIAWTVDQVTEARAHLVDMEMIVHDPATAEYFIRRFFRFEHIRNDNHREGVERIIGELDSEIVRDAAFAEYEERMEALAAEAQAKAEKKAAKAEAQANVHPIPDHLNKTKFMTRR